MKIRRTFWKGLHKPPPSRLKSQKEPREEEREMVKGTARRVIVIKSPDPKIFEEAIFVVRDDYLRTPGITQKQLLRQAKQTAKHYSDSIGKNRPFAFLSRSPVPFIAAAGAAATGLAYVVLHMAGVY